jgi:acetyl esterase/lipase
MRPPAPETLDALTAEMRAVNEALARGASLSQWRARRAPVLPVEVRSVDLGGRDLAARVIVPPDVRAVYLETHGGGGWSGGSAAMCDGPNADLALACSVAVFAFDHRLAPADPYPAPADDCEAAALWLLEVSRREFGVSAMFIGGRTAGAHLAALTALRLRDRHGAADRIAGLSLMNGLFDLSMTPSQRQAGDDTLITNADDIKRVLDEFLPGTTCEERRDPSISPLYADLTGMPPALFTCGTLDPLLDDTLFMAARWQAAGNMTELALYPDAPHGFVWLDIAMAHAAQRRVQQWIDDRLASFSPAAPGPSPTGGRSRRGHR